MVSKRGGVGRELQPPILGLISLLLEGTQGPHPQLSKSYTHVVYNGEPRKKG